MSDAIELYQHGATIPVDLENATLDELADEARREHEQVAVHLFGALGHFMRLGDILLAARPKVPEGDWIRWLQTIGINHYYTAARAMRLAYYKDHLPAEAFEAIPRSDGRMLNPTWTRALQYVRGLPDIHPKGRETYPPEARLEAQRLRGDGMSYRDIAEMLDVGATTVRMWCDIEYYRSKVEARRRSKRKETEARRALRDAERRQEAERLAKVTGGELEVAYGLVRRALAAVAKVPAAEVVERSLLRSEEELITVMRQQRETA